MTHEQREIQRKKRVLEYAEQTADIRLACRHFGIARSTFYLWRDRYREIGEAGLTRRN
jgi:transposase-like protein